MESKKFGRKFRLLVQENATEVEKDMVFLEIQDPFTINFSVNRDTNSSLNTMNVSIHNLAKTTRAKIFKDRYSDIYKRVILQAGYETIYTIFQGSMFSAFSSRSGSDIITEIECKDGGIDVKTAQFSDTFAKGIDTDDIIDKAIQQFKTITKGSIGGNKTTKKRATSYADTVYDVLGREIIGVFVDNEKLHALKDNEIIDYQILKFNSQTGLLNVPKRQDTYIEIDVLFEPRVQVAQAVQVESSIQPEFNGQYKVIGLKHAGVISSTMDGSVVTTLSLLMPDQLSGGQFKTVKAT